MTTPAEVLKTFARKGVAVTFTRVVEGTTYDVADGDVDRTSSVASVPALLGNLSGNNYDPAAAVEVGDKLLLVPCAGISFMPAAGDKVSIKGTTYVVVSARTVDPDGSEYLYEVQVRR